MGMKFGRINVWLKVGFVGFTNVEVLEIIHFFVFMIV